MLATILLNIAIHLLKYWFVYATFLVLLLAPFPVTLVVVLGWLGFFCYRLRKG